LSLKFPDIGTPQPARQVRTRLLPGIRIRRPQLADESPAGAAAIETGEGPSKRRVEYHDRPAARFEAGFWSGLGFMCAYLMATAAAAVLLAVGWGVRLLLT